MIIQKNYPLPSIRSFKSPKKKRKKSIHTKCNTENNRKNKAVWETFNVTKNGKIATDITSQSFKLKIKTHEMTPRVIPFCVRCQSAEKGSIKQQIDDINFIEDWNGIYGGGTSEQAQGYLNPTVSENKFLKVYTNDKIKVLELTGNFMSSSEITGDIKAAAILNLFKKNTKRLKPQTIEAMKLTTNHEKEKEFPNTLHLSRVLKYLGYDAIITQETKVDNEAIILNATKFLETTAATVHGSREKFGMFTRFVCGNIKTNDINSLNLQQTPTMISPDSETINPLAGTSTTSSPTSVNIDRLIAANTSVMSPELNQNNNPSDEQPKTPTNATQSNGFNFTEGDTDHEASSSDSGSDSENTFNRLVYNGSTPTRPLSTTKKKPPKRSQTNKEPGAGISIVNLTDRFEAVNLGK